MSDLNFRTSIKGKIIIAFLLCSLALIGSYFVNKLAFKEIYNSVEDLSYTNQKLIIVNNIFFEINESEKTFRNMVTNDHSFETFLTQSNTLRLFTDSLRVLCADNYDQVKLIDSIHSLLKIRGKLLINYVEFRRALKSNNPVLKHAALLDSIISIDKPTIDSVVFTQEQNKITTKVESEEIEEPIEKKGFLKKLFKSKKNEPKKVQRTVQEEVNTKIDTIVQTRKEDVSDEVQRIINAMGHEQRVRSADFFRKEAKLASFENSFHNKIADLLADIEKNITYQTELTHHEAKDSIDRSISRIYLILFLFFLFAVIIVFLMLAEVNKNTKYRLLLEQAKEEAERHSLSRQRFLSNMSHEIRTPLQSIIGYAEQIRLQDSPDKEYMDAVQNSSEHLLQVINEILDYNRINAGRFTFEKHNFSVQSVLNETISILQYQAEQKGIELLLHEEEITEHFVLGDEFRLKQILMNLIGNAIKFTDKGQVSIKVTRETIQDKEHYAFEVRDTGIGIPGSMQDRIFDQFEQIDWSVEQRYKGSGLGLSIVKALVEGQGGHIAVTSEPGKGSCFTFNIQYDPSFEYPVIREQPEGPSFSYQGMVWLVDDDPLILRLCSDILTKHTISHLSFNSAEALLRYESSTAPSMIMMDIRMPGINGIQLLHKIRNKYASRAVIVALTAQALPEEQEEILSHGFDGLLLKPFKERELMSLLKPHTIYSLAPSISTEVEGLDQSILKRMLAGNQEDIKDVLFQYIAETTKDMAIFHEAGMHNQPSEASLILHRIAGRTAQIGATELGATLRKMEIAIHNDQPVDPLVLEHVWDQLRDLMKGIESHILKKDEMQ